MAIPFIDPYTLTVLATVITVTLLTIYIVFTRTERRKLLWVTRITGTETVFKTQRLRRVQTTVSLGKKSFPINMARPAFRKRGTVYYLIDFKDGQLFHQAHKNPVSAEFMDAILNQEVCKQLVSTLERVKFQEILVYILLAIGMGVAMGYIVGLIAPV